MEQTSETGTPFGERQHMRGQTGAGTTWLGLRLPEAGQDTSPEPAQAAKHVTVAYILPPHPVSAPSAEAAPWYLVSIRDTEAAWAWHLELTGECIEGLG